LLTQTPRFSIYRSRAIFLELPAYAEVHIVVVLRPYFSWLENFISQSMKKGPVSLSETKLNPKYYLRSWELNFQKLLDFYETSLPNGGKYIHVLPFSRKVNAPPPTKHCKLSPASRNLIRLFAAGPDVALHGPPPDRERAFRNRNLGRSLGGPAGLASRLARRRRPFRILI
jgi:hypothetical protein